MPSVMQDLSVAEFIGDLPGLHPERGAEPEVSEITLPGRFLRPSPAEAEVERLIGAGWEEPAAREAVALTQGVRDY
jgi:hypothetical protein